MEGWTPLSFQAENSHVIVKFSTLARFHCFLFLLATLNYNVKNLILLIYAFGIRGFAEIVFAKTTIKI